MRAMNRDDDFERRIWGTQSDATDTPAPPYQEDEELLETRIWNPAVGVLSGQPLLWLIVAEPANQRGVVLSIPPGAIVGRQGDVRWDDPHMSRKHAHILLVNHSMQAGQQVYAIAPYSDRNGTLVNGKLIQRVTILRENDRIEMGNTIFVVKVLA
jgi:hypothetical protein